jgi:hypothetical protein
VVCFILLRGSRTVVAVAFEQVDRAPYGKACADSGDEGLQYVDCAVEEFHCIDLLMFILGKMKTPSGWDGAKRVEIKPNRD